MQITIWILTTLMLSTLGCMSEVDGRESASAFATSIGYTPVRVTCSCPGPTCRCAVVVKEFPQPIGMTCFGRGDCVIGSGR